MDDSSLRAGNDYLYELFEVEASRVLLQKVLIGDNLKEIFVEKRTLHDQQKTVFVFSNVVVKILDYSLHICIMQMLKRFSQDIY